MRIRIDKLPDGKYKASVEDSEKELHGYGNTREEAVGDMVLRHRLYFGITAIMNCERQRSGLAVSG